MSAARSAATSRDAAPAASLFVGKGLVAKAVSRKLQLPSLEASGERLWNGKTVVLMDDTTAGPAEVFAAALHDRADATTVGEPTVGMAILQRLVPTESGGSLFMTVARYVSPNGTAFGGKGLQPDDRVLAFPGDPESDGREGRDPSSSAGSRCCAARAPLAGRRSQA